MTLRYRNLVIVLLAWMLLIAAACGLILDLVSLESYEQNRPRRTRPPQQELEPIEPATPALIPPPTS